MTSFLLFFALFGYVYEDSDSLFVDNDSLVMCGNHQYNIKVQLVNNGKLKIRQWNGADSTGWLLINAPLIYLHDSSSINGLGLGNLGGNTSHPDGYGPGYGEAGGVSGGGGGGAGYGGDGGAGGDLYPGLGGITYGNPSDTLIDIGSGGGAGRLSAVDGFGGTGGAKSYLRAQRIIIDSSFVLADGKSGYDGALEAGGAGSGGGIMLWADTVTIHYSSISADGGVGGNGDFGGGGGGGGGRIKIFYSSLLDTLNLILSVQGGLGGLGSYGNGEAGLPGSIYIGPIVDLEEITEKIKINFSIQPNPAKNRIQITSEYAPIKLRLYDISGRIVRDLFLTGKVESIELDGLNQGIYFLKAEERNIVKIILLK